MLGLQNNDKIVMMEQTMENKQSPGAEKKDRAQQVMEWQKEVAKIDCRAMAKWTDPELAAWQANSPSESPQYRVAEHEWQRRLLADQIKAARWNTLFGVLGALGGVVLGRLLRCP